MKFKDILNEDGEYFEFVSTEPMEYFIEEYRDDLT